MKITAALKAFLVANHGLAADATDDAVRQLVSAKLLDGSLTAAKMAELSADPVSAQAKLEELVSGQVARAVTPLMVKVEELLAKANAPVAPVAPVAKSYTQAEQDAAIAAAVAATKAAQPLPGVNLPTPAHLLTANAGNNAGTNGAATPQVTVVRAIDRYSSAKSAVHHGSDSRHPHLRGQRAEFLGRPLDTASHADKAVIGAYFKWMVNCSAKGQDVPRGLKMSDHDQDLVRYALHELPWTGTVGGEGPRGFSVDNRKLSEIEVKAILDDSTSGGLEAAPIVFDDAVITTPVLHGELFPLVSVTNLSRGRRVEAFSIGNPTITSGTAEGTEIGLFDTSAFIAALDTTIYPAVGAIEIGLDFEEDAPNDIGAIVVERYGEKVKEWLDEQIANGDGTTEPQGIFNASGTTTVLSVNSGSLPLTVGDAETLIFGVNKEFRNAKGGRNVFIGNETTYRRFRSIPVGSGDARRVFGMDHMMYTLHGFPYKVQHNVANTKAAFVNMAYYRMYRRLGMQIKVVENDKELARKNMRLIVLRMRWGGKMELGGAAAIVSDLPS